MNYEEKYNNLRRDYSKLEALLQYKENEIKKLKNTNYFKRLDEKDKLIHYLQEEIKRLKNHDYNFINNKLNVMDKSKLIVLEEENEKLKIEIANFEKERNELYNKYKNLINLTDQKIFKVMQAIPNKIGQFNINKEEAAKFLVDQTKIYLNEKENYVKENNNLKALNKSLLSDNMILKYQIKFLKINNNNDYKNFNLKNSINELNKSLNFKIQ
jgi:hypothetical protein